MQPFENAITWTVLVSNVCRKLHFPPLKWMVSYLQACLSAIPPTNIRFTLWLLDHFSESLACIEWTSNQDATKSVKSFILYQCQYWVQIRRHILLTRGCKQGKGVLSGPWPLHRTRYPTTTPTFSRNGKTAG